MENAQNVGKIGQTLDVSGTDIKRMKRKRIINWVSGGILAVILAVITFIAGRASRSGFCSNHITSNISNISNISNHITSNISNISNHVTPYPFMSIGAGPLVQKKWTKSTLKSFLLLIGLVMIVPLISYMFRLHTPIGRNGSGIGYYGEAIKYNVYRK